MTIDQNFDYIICGGGMAGLSLAYRICMTPELKEKKIAIIEPNDKNINDRTWAFWESENDIFEHLVFKKWNTCHIKSNTGETLPIALDNFQYKVIRGIDFYRFTISFLKKQKNIFWVKDYVESIVESTNEVIVSTKNQQLLAKYAFDSTFQPNFTDPNSHHLIQHFKGYVVQTDYPTFDDSSAQIMNFDIEQKNECRFMYVLPFSPTQALVEFTLFSQKLLDTSEYDSQLDDYLRNHLSIKNYRIEETEFGIIPMSDVSIDTFIGKRIIRIGTSGGFTNPATGFTFKNTQSKLAQIVKELQKGNSPIYKQSIWENRFSIYASVMLNVLIHKRQRADTFFFDLYKKNKIQALFRFLDGKSSFLEELGIMYSTEKSIFSLALIDVLWKKVINDLLRPLQYLKNQ